MQVRCCQTIKAKLTSRAIRLLQSQASTMIEFIAAPGDDDVSTLDVREAHDTGKASHVDGQSSSAGVERAYPMASSLAS
jgi:hypothetical protein